MNKLTVLTLLFVICSLFAAANADVPPDAGYKRVSLKLIVEPQEDFSDYRFFIKSGADLNEIVLKKGERSSMGSLGGGAWYRAGTFLAVPKKSLATLSESQTSEKLNELQKAIYDGKVAGAIELVRHSFASEVPNSEAADLQDSVYRLERSKEKGITAVLISSEAKSGKAPKRNELQPYSNEPKTSLFWATVIGGALLTFSLICLGVWALRRSKIKSTEFGSPTK